MAYIRFDIDDNCIDVVRGPHKRRVPLTAQGVGEGGALLSEGRSREERGVRLLDALSPNELDTLAAQRRLKALLEADGVPHLYIGPAPVGVEGEAATALGAGGRRPDFLLHPHATGPLLVALKCAGRRGFTEISKAHFVLTRSEIEGLARLGRSLSMPLWVALADADAPETDEGAARFHFAPIDRLHDYYRRLLECDPELADWDIQWRVPDELLHETIGRFELVVEGGGVDSALAEEFAKRHRALVRRTVQELKMLIRGGGVYKTKVWKALDERKAEICRFTTGWECFAVLDKLIRDGEVRYEPRKPLELVEG